MFLKQRLYRVLEAGKTTDLASRIFDPIMVSLILLNVVAVAAESVPSLDARYHDQFVLFEVVSVFLFTVEYLLRLWVCTEHPPLRHEGPISARLKFAATPYAIIDLLAVLPFYLAFLLPADLRILRIFRLVRLLKLARYSPALSTIGRVLYTERRALVGSLILMLGLLLIAAGLEHVVEREAQPDKFGSIPNAMWWALATLTTVGYGDVVPITPVGKMIGAVFMVFGLGMFALPIGIIATGFAQEMHQREFVVSWGMVARVPLFAGLPSASVIEIARLLHSRTVEPGTVIARRGEEADCMYFILNGEVELTISGRRDPLFLGEGDFMGEVALLRHTRRTATMTAFSRCHLMLLDADDFHRLLEVNPDIRERITLSAEERVSREELEPEGDIVSEEIHEP